MTTLEYSNQFATPAPIHDNINGLLSHKHDNEPAILSTDSAIIDAATVSRVVQELDKGLSLPPMVQLHDAEAVTSQVNKQQLYVPVVHSVTGQENGVSPAVHGQEIDAIVPFTTQAPISVIGIPATTVCCSCRNIAQSTAKAADFKAVSPVVAKEDPLVAKDQNNQVTITPAMEAYANEATTLPKIIPVETVNPPFPEQKYHNLDSMSSATRLKRRIMETDELIVCPGVYDGFSARIALSVGFSALYMTGAGTTASRLGMADLGVAQLHDMREHAEMIANLDPRGPPLIADMDTGYGGPIMVTNSVLQYIRAGVAGFHIEDQVQTKRCGHLQGKKVVEMEVFLSRIRAAKAAKDRARSDIVLIARTDANQQHGYDECIARLQAARAIGADVGLLEGFTSKAQARQAVRDLAPWPLLLNSVENGTSPLITVHEAREMGFRIMIFSFAALAPAYTAIKATLEMLKNDGVTGTREELTPKVLFEVCGLKDSMEVDAAAGGLAFAGGV